MVLHGLVLQFSSNDRNTAKLSVRVVLQNVKIIDKEFL